MGKTTVANWLAAKDCTIIDTDQISRELTGPSGAALPSIVAAFSEELIGEDGALDRPKMAARVFRNEDDRRTLESILHPMIRDEWQARVSRYRGDSARHAVHPGNPSMAPRVRRKELKSEFCDGRTAQSAESK